jgi:hypothetical protein
VDDEATKFELIVNRATAEALGLSVPPALHAGMSADSA